MAQTIVDLSDAAVRKQWAQRTLAANLSEMEFPLLVGGGDDSVVKIDTDLSKGGATGQGDTVTTSIHLPLKEDGVVGRDTVEGTEEELLWKNFSATIEELNKAVSTGGAMDKQLVPFKFVDIGKKRLAEWYSNKMSNFIVNHLCGNTTFKEAGKTFAQDPTAPSTHHIIYAGGAASEAAITAAHQVTLGTLRAAVQRAKRMWAANGHATEEDAAHDGYFKIQPLKINGRDRYVILMHSLAYEQMKNNYNKGEFHDAVNEAKLATYKGWNASAVFDDYVIIASERVYSPLDNVYRNVLCGKNAGVLLFGGAGDNRETATKFVAYTGDAERYLNFRVEAIFGVKKVVFDSIDFATLAISGYATPLDE